MNTQRSVTDRSCSDTTETELPGLTRWAHTEAAALRRNDRVLLSTSAVLALCALALLAAYLIAFKRDRDRLASVHSGLPEGYVLWLLGPPDESDGPPLPVHFRPFASDCPGADPCYPDRCVRRVLYYRAAWTSLEVYYDADGVVQCVERPMVGRMETW